MAKRIIEIDPVIYATDHFFRREMIWKGMSSHGSHINDPIAYLNRMEKKFGKIVKEAAGLAYQELPKNCLAVVETKIDEALCSKYGWQTVQEWRDESFSILKKDLNNA